MRKDNTHLYIQSALLYTTSEGERRIKVHNLAIPITNVKSQPFEFLDINAITHFLARNALSRVNIHLSF